MKRLAFTLLELVIVIIIVGVLAALALPRFALLIEGSRALEAINTIAVLRRSMERCYLMNNGSFAKCSFRSTALGLPPDTLDVDDPNAIPNAHFVYKAEPDPSGKGYILEGYRNTKDSGGPWFGRSIYMGYGCKPTIVGGGVSFAWPLDDTIYWAAHPPYSGVIPQ